MALFISLNTNANGLWCSKSYRFESFSYGMAESLTNSASRPKVIDELCWRLGQKRGTVIKKNHIRNEKHCLLAFTEGKDDGMNGISTNSSYPLDCYRSGVNYGESKLSISARESRTQVVGKDCIRSYKKGRLSGLQDIVPSPGMDNKLSYCYMTGHSDGSLFRGLL